MPKLSPRHAAFVMKRINRLGCTTKFDNRNYAGRGRQMSEQA